MKALYYRQPDCRGCYDLGFMGDGTGCKACKSHCTEEVTVGQVGVGAFGNKAVIFHKNGSMETVPMTDLVLQFNESKGDDK